jgi:hypothetical protein
MAPRNITFEAPLEPNTTIIAVIRPACKHLSSKSQKIIVVSKMPLYLAKDDWLTQLYLRCGPQDLVPVRARW